MGKSVKLSDVDDKYSDETGLFSYQCTSCEKVFPDTQLATAKHLADCSVSGFLKFHSIKVLDEPVVADVDRKIFAWKQKAVKSMKSVPEVMITLDGYGSRNNLDARNLAKVVKNANTESLVRTRQVRVKKKLHRQTWCSLATKQSMPKML